MKVALVSVEASPLTPAGEEDVGGQQVHVAGLAKALAGRGCQVRVYTRQDAAPAPDRQELAAGAVLERLPAGPSRLVAERELLGHAGELGYQLARRWSSDPPDVVHAHSWLSGLTALIARRETDVPVVLTFHRISGAQSRADGPTADGQVTGTQRLRLEQAVARDVTHLVATCSDEAARVGRLGAGRRAVTIIPCGVDVEQFTEDGPTWPRDSRPRIVSAGALEEREGFDALVAALRALPSAELVLAGGPPGGDVAAHPEAARLAELAERLGVRDRVHLFGRVPRAAMPALMRSADVVACVPSSAAFGIVPLEAMACRRPVVASTVGGLVDTVADGVTGVLVPPGRPDRLAAVLRGLLDDPFLLEALGQAGIDRARSRYSWGRIARETAAVYERVRADGPPAGVATGEATGGMADVH